MDKQSILLKKLVMTETLSRRIRQLNDCSGDGEVVVYIMSRDQRVRDNHALLAAQADAVERDVPLVVLFNLYSKSGVRAHQHYQFMLDGLRQVGEQLERLNISFVLTNNSTQLAALKKLNQNHSLGAVYFDFSPLNRPTREREQAVKELDAAVYVVDTHNIVPVWEASDKQEYAARTIRPKLHSKFSDYLESPLPLDSQIEPGVDIDSLSFNEALLSVQAKKRDQLKIKFTAGESAAQQRLEEFIDQDLEHYHKLRNDPAEAALSGLSPYFHFGQLAPLRAVLEVEQAAKQDEKLREGADVFIEEAFVRRELSDNFCYYQPNYRSLEAAPDWAQQTLADHAGDSREYIYNFNQLEQAQTHDDAWNAAQQQMTTTGKMHGYMRMYWAKKILEWTDSPKQALEWAINLNDMYELDGNDPNGYVGCLWSITGVHDRGWTEREIFGKIRYMNLNGLKRKFDINSYIEQWSGNT